MDNVKKYYAAAGGIVQDEEPSGSGTEAPAMGGTLAVGDVVTFTGETHYTSANASAGKACKGGKAKITTIAEKGKHPYHLIRVAGGGATVYGWVDTADIAGAGTNQSIKVGSIVRLRSGGENIHGRHA